MRNLAKRIIDIKSFVEVTYSGSCIQCIAPTTIWRAIGKVFQLRGVERQHVPDHEWVVEKC